MAEDQPNMKSENYVKLLGERIKELRGDRDMTQLELSFKMDIDPTVLRRYEKGKVEMGFTTLIRFAEVFEVSVDELLDISSK